MKKQTRKELETENRMYHFLLGGLVILVFSTYLFYVLPLQLERNEMIKKGVSLLENKTIDYHTDKNLFCEHYNGTYTYYWNKRLQSSKGCVFNTKDLVSYCSIKELNKTWAFSEECPAVK